MCKTDDNKNDNIKLVFSVEGKGEVVLSDWLETDSISIWLNRYGVRNHKADKTTPDIFPKDPLAINLYEYSYCKRYLRNGYVYVYDETLKHISEYRIYGSIAFTILKNERNITEDARERDTSLRGKYFISASFGSTVWIAFSHIQWSAKYVKKYMDEADFRDVRGQKFNTMDVVGDDFCHLDDIQVYSLPETEQEAAAIGEENSELRDSYRFDEICGYTSLESGKRKIRKMEEKFIPYFVFFSVHDPIGCAHDIAEDFTTQVEYHLAFTQGLPFGKTPEEMLANKENSSFINPNDPVTLQYYSLYQSSSLMNKFILENPANNNEFGGDINKESLRAVLGLDERKKSYDKMVSIHNALGRLLETNYYHNVLIDACECSLKGMAEGQTITLTHHGLLALKPACIDNELASKIGFIDNCWEEYMYNSFFYGGLAPQKPTIKGAGQPLQYVSRELLNADYRETSLFDDIKKGIKNIIIIANDLFINVDTSLGLYVYLIKTEIDKQQYASRINSILDKKKNIANLKKLAIGKIRDNAVQQLNQVADKTLKEYSWFSKIFRKNTIKKDVVNRAENIADDAIRKMDDISEVASTRINNLDDELEKLKIEELKLNEKYKRAKWVETKSFQKFLGTLATINLVLAAKEAYKNPNFSTVSNTIGSAIETTAAISAFAMSESTNQWILKKVFRAKNLKISVACRVSLTSTAILSVVTIWDGVMLWGKKDYETAALYIASGVTGFAAAVVIWKGYAAGLASIGPWGWALIAISFVLMIIAYFTYKSELERFIIASVYCDIWRRRNRIPGISGMTPVQAMKAIYNNGEPKAHEFEADNGDVYDLKDFRNMLRWLFEKLSYYTCDFQIQSHHSDGVFHIIDAFNIYCNFNAMLPTARIEYAMIINQGYLFAFDGRKPDFIKTTYAPRVTIGENSVSVQFSSDLSQWKQDMKKRIGDYPITLEIPSSGEGYNPYPVDNKGKDYNEDLVSGRNMTYLFAFRIVYDQFSGQSLPMSADDNGPEYFVLSGDLFSPDNDIQFTNPHIRQSRMTKSQLGL